jgi:hypothetical protein
MQSQYEAVRRTAPKSYAATTVTFFHPSANQLPTRDAGLFWEITQIAASLDSGARVAPFASIAFKEKQMSTKRNRAGKVLAMLSLICAVAASTAASAHAQATQGSGQVPLFLTATNPSGAANFLAVVNTRTQETNFVPTGGVGGASGNAGGVAVEGQLAAVVNFGSSNVTIFVRQGNAMQPTQMIQTVSRPVSVAFGRDHLVVLGLTTAQSFPVYGNTVGASDGTVQLQIGDGSAGQIVTYSGGAVYTEKSGGIGEFSLSADGMAGLSGPSIPVMLPPAPNNSTPLGLVARDAYVYVTIAHSDLEALVVNGQIVSTAVGPTPFKDQSGNLLHAPCWNALSGQFLYSSDSPGKQLLRYLVSDNNVFFDKAAVAKLGGAPTDLYVQNNLLGVIDGGDGINYSDVSLFNIESEGELTLRFALRIPSPINGAAIIR